MASLLYFTDIGLLFAIEQWITSAQENVILKTPLSCKIKLFEVAIHKTGDKNYTNLAMKDTSSDSLYIASPLTGASSSYWFGVFSN